MVIDELEAQARRLGLQVDGRNATHLRVGRPDLVHLDFFFAGDRLTSTAPCLVPGNNFPGNAEQVNLDWGMAVLLQYASAILGDPRFRPAPPSVPGEVRVPFEGYTVGYGQSSDHVYLIHPAHLPVSQIVAARQAVVGSIENYVMRLAIRDHLHNIAIRALEPRDVGLRHWVTSPLVEDRGRPYIRHTLPNDVVIGIWGVYNRSRGRHACRLEIGAGQRSSVRAVLDLYSLYGLGSSVGLLAQPVIFTRNETMWVDVYADQNQPKGERLGLLGFIAEPIGVSVSVD